MLAKMWLNALSDRGHSLLNTQSTRNIYSGALPKSSNIRALMLSGSGSTSSGLSFPKYNTSTHCCSRVYQTVLKTAGVSPSIVLLGQQCFRRNTAPGITSLHGVLFQLAQKLYEGVKLSDNEVAGLITYMRTDGLRISEEAAESIRSLVTERYGKAYASDGIRKFHNKVKNAQEAHEAIRPTNICRLPSMLVNVLEEDALKLYTLIWCQAMACQMKQATVDQAREYVTIRSRRIFPEFRGRMLDDVSAGLTEWKNVLKNFWSRFHKDRERVSKVEVHQVERMLEETFGYYLFATLPGKNRVCPSCKEGTLGFKVSRHGAGYFIGCDKYPKCSCS